MRICSVTQSVGDRLQLNIISVADAGLSRGTLTVGVSNYYLTNLDQSCLKKKTFGPEVGEYVSKALDVALSMLCKIQCVYSSRLDT